MSLAARLAAPGLTLALDAATTAEDAAHYLVRLARNDAAALHRAARQVELRHPQPDSARARHAIRMLRAASTLAASVTPLPGGRPERRHDPQQTVDAGQRVKVTFVLPAGDDALSVSVVGTSTTGIPPPQSCGGGVRPGR